jgi:hypothetical protein
MDKRGVLWQRTQNDGWYCHAGIGRCLHAATELARPLTRLYREGEIETLRGAE